MGAQTVGMLLGAWLTDPRDEGACDVDLLEPRIKAGALLTAVAGDDAKETDDENPDRLAITQRLSWAYLRSAL